MVGDTTPARTSIRQDADRRWRVDFVCGCPPTSRLHWGVAVALATKHVCPEPWPDLPIRRKRGKRWV